LLRGGVGKTSLSHSFAIRASQYGAKVLVIDIDQQANLTQAFGIDEDDLPTIFEVIQNSISLDDSILNITNNLHLVPSSMNVSFLDRYLQLNQENLSTVLKDRTDRAINELGYDYVIFDCPPAISSATTAATCAADRIIMPVTPMKFSLQGLKASFEEIKSIEKKFKKKDLQKNIIFNRFDARKTSSNEYLRGLAGDSSYNQFMMNCFIRENSELENCINQKHSVFDYSKKSNAREDLDLFTKNIMGLNENAFLH
jgi:chromosome partitioning protein